MECNPFFCWPEEPPESVGSKGPKGQQHEELLKKQSHAHEFALPLKHACAAEPLCCIASGLGAPCGCTACYSRMLVLESYAGGIDDYLCCQGYVGGFCCTDMRTVLPGSRVGLFLEGCLCPVFSLSIARIHLMDKKSLRPDPMDFQIIACANCLQLLSCALDCIAIFVREARDAADLFDLIADCFTLSVAGCMGAQIYHEVRTDPTVKQRRTAPEPKKMERAPLTDKSASSEYGSTISR